MAATGYVSSTGDTRKVDKTGATMTGELVLPDTSPDTPLTAAPRAYVDAAVAGASGGVPSNSVEPGTEYGQDPDAGASAQYARGDHTHGTPGLPPTGTTGGTYAAGDDARITGALQKAQNLSDVTNPATARNSLGLGTAAIENAGAFDSAGSASAAFAAAVADAAETYVALAGDQVINGEKTFNDRIPLLPAIDPQYDNQATRKAYVDARVAEAGGGSSIVSLDGRIDLQIVAPPPVAGWAIVTTSGGVEIGTSVPAAVGDRLWFSPSFLRTFGIFLDLGIKAAAGGVSRYVSSGTATPETDGYAPLYPQSSFAGVAGLRQFIVQAGEVDGSGNAKIVLAYKGSSADGTSQKVYFGGGPGYSGAIFVANMGQ